MATRTILAHWMPVTWVTYGLDYLVWGMNPLGYHLTSLVLHAANAALFYLLALELLRRAAPSVDARASGFGGLVAALFFAVHPLRTESVVWISARRDLVSGCWTFLCLLAYLRMVDAPPARRGRWLGLSVGCYALAIAAKSMVMTLPIVLLVLDVWPLRRLRGRLRDWVKGPERWVLLEKIPYVMLAIVGGTVALLGIVLGGYLTPVATYSGSARLGMLGYALAFYVRQTFVPSGLAALHELPLSVQLFDPSFLLSTVAVAIVSVGTFLLRRRWPAALAAWAAYLTVLMPISGPVHSGHQLVADRYSYLSCLPWALMIGGGVAMIIDAAWRARLASRLPVGLVGTVAVWLLGLGALSWNQAQTWKDTETLWRYAIDVDPGCALCHSQLGADLGNRGLYAPALEQFAQGLALRPDDAGIRGNLGLALLRMNRPAEALSQFRMALARRPHDASLRNRVGATLIRQERFEEAAAELRDAVRVDPDHAEALANLALATHALGHAEEAKGYLRRALALKPDVTARFDPHLIEALLAPAPPSAPPAR